MKWVSWVVAVLAVLVAGAVVLIVCATNSDGSSRSSLALLHAKGLLQACEAYHSHPDSGKKYPSRLADLHTPPFGGTSFLKNGAEDLTDPWGNPFKYAVVPDEKGEPELYVWCEQTVDGKLKFIGAKQAARGSTVLFGL